MLEVKTMKQYTAGTKLETIMISQLNPRRLESISKVGLNHDRLPRPGRVELCGSGTPIVRIRDLLILNNCV